MVNPNRYIPLIYPCYPLIYPIHVDKTIITRYVIVHWFIRIPSWGYSIPQHWVQLGNIIPLKPFKTYSWCFQKPLLSLRRFVCAAPRVQIEAQQLQGGRDVATLGPRAAAQRASTGGWVGKKVEKSWKNREKCGESVWNWCFFELNLQQI